MNEIKRSFEKVLKKEGAGNHAVACPCFFKAGEKGGLKVVNEAQIVTLTLRAIARLGFNVAVGEEMSVL